MQSETKLFIKGMVCNRCVMVVKEELRDLGHSPLAAELGAVTIAGGEENLDKAEVEKRLTVHGFSLLEDPKAKIVNAVKALVNEVYSGNYDFPEQFRFAELVKERLGKEYDTVSDIFIAREKQTIEHYIISFRINKVKEFLVYSNETLAAIAFRLNFSSTSHLSAQFKQQTGLTASYFKEIRKKKTDLIVSAG